MKTIVLTGATSGIGKETARELLNLGHTVISNARNKYRAEEVRNELIQNTGNNQFFIIESDFSNFKSVKKFTDSIKEDFRAIDILINNAGTWEMKFFETIDGIETNLQVNHLSPMLLTLELIPLLEKSGDGRIINTSSGAHRRDIFDLDDMEWRKKPYDGVATYSQSKLFNILFSLQLSKMFAGKPITANTVHPGYVKTALFKNMGSRNWSGIPDARQGARSALYAGLSEEMQGVSGKYIYLEGEDPNLSPVATDESLAEILWSKSLTYIDGYISNNLFK